MKKAIVIVLFLLNGSIYAQTQSFQVDTTFKPFFDIRNQIYPTISDIYENPTDGRIYVGGNFESYYGSIPYQGSVCYYRAGSLFKAYSFQFGPGSIGSIQRVNDTIFAFSNGDNTVLRDTLGNGIGFQWRANYLKSVKCRGEGYFFKDGSSLFANGSNNWGVPCPIINPPDTFPGRHIIKLTPQGLWDSTFVPDANEAPWGFVPYDSNRLFICGKPFRFTHYNGHRINGLCRIYLDGTLDTTFTSPFADTVLFGVSYYPDLIEDNGKFFICGHFVLKDYPNKYITLARFNADGSLDTTFMNFSGPDHTLIPGGGTNSIVPTVDGGYLVGGVFNTYQGYAQNSIAKIDSNGKVEPQFFTGKGPDSAIFLHQKDPIMGVGPIVKSKFGGYYIGGHFLKWDGKPVQPIIRLKLVNTTGISENKTAKTRVKVYPNPTNDKITIKSSATLKEIEILDLLGKRIQFQTINNSNSSFIIDLSRLPQGIYLLSIQLENGERLSRKVVRN